MEEENNPIAVLIIKFLREDLSLADELELKKWVESSESNAAFFERFKDEDYVLNGLRQYEAAKKGSCQVKAKLDLLVASRGMAPIRWSK